MEIFTVLLRRKSQCSLRMNAKAAQFLALSFALYWVICFGHELCHTVLLYLHSSSIFKILGSDNEQPISYTRRALNNSSAATFTNHDVNNNRTTSSTTQIPLIIHRMWKDDRIPDQWKGPYEKCKETYEQRNWTTILWTDATIRSFLKENYEYFLPTYDSYPYDIQRVDAARYFILYHYGGVYLDLDIIHCREGRDITDLVRVMEKMQAYSMFPITDPVGVSNDVMFASKRNRFFLRLIETLPEKNRWFGLPYLTVLYSTGPMFLSLACMDYPVTKTEVLALSSTLYSKTSERYFHHLKGSTWHSVDASVAKWIVQNRFRLGSPLLLWLVFVVIKGSTVNVQRKEKIKPHRLSV